jgi:hypothetical protein
MGKKNRTGGGVSKSAKRVSPQKMAYQHDSSQSQDSIRESPRSNASKSPTSPRSPIKRAVSASSDDSANTGACLGIMSMIDPVSVVAAPLSSTPAAIRANANGANAGIDRFSLTAAVMDDNTTVCTGHTGGTITSSSTNSSFAQPSSTGKVVGFSLKTPASTSGGASAGAAEGGAFASGRTSVSSQRSSGRKIMTPGTPPVPKGTRSLDIEDTEVRNPSKP